MKYRFETLIGVVGGVLGIATVHASRIFYAVNDIHMSFNQAFQDFHSHFYTCPECIGADAIAGGLVATFAVALSMGDSSFPKDASELEEKFQH